MDAAHMGALAAPSRAELPNWTERGLALAAEHPEASHWAGPLLNNLGWERHEAGEYEAALQAFERALRARERDPGNPEAIAIARYALGKTLRALDRCPEAIPLLDQSVEWADDDGRPDGWFHEELAEEYAAVGRGEDARRQAQLALGLLESRDPVFAADGERALRLRTLASSGTATPDG